MKTFPQLLNSAHIQSIVPLTVTVTTAVVVLLEVAQAVVLLAVYCFQLPLYYIGYNVGSRNRVIFQKCIQTCISTAAFLNLINIYFRIHLRWSRFTKTVPF